MRAFLLVLLLGVSSAAFAGTRSIMVWDCGKPSGMEVIDLACNIYWEARNQPVAGQYLVALSVRNRVLSEDYPDTYSEVSYEARRSRRTGKLTPMYSWTLDGLPDRVHNMRAWGRALVVALDVIERHETIVDITHGCMWYHRTDIEPYWAPSYWPTTRIGAHQCYAENEQEFLNSLANQVQWR